MATFLLTSGIDEDAGFHPPGADLSSCVAPILGAISRFRALDQGSSKSTAAG
jgi:hypothetical protein